MFSPPDPSRPKPTVLPYPTSAQAAHDPCECGHPWHEHEAATFQRAGQCNGFVLRSNPNRRVLQTSVYKCCTCVTYKRATHPRNLLGKHSGLSVVAELTTPPAREASLQLSFLSCESDA